MSRTIVLVILQLCLDSFIIVISSSAATAAKNVDSGSVLSKTPVGTTVKTLSTSSEIPSKATTASTTSASANTTTIKPKQNKKLISSIPTFDFSLPKKVPKPEVVKSCDMKDMCISGFCIKGTCKTKNCALYCVCDPGFTGQICDKNITQIELKNGKGNGHPETASTTSTKDKELGIKKLAATPKSKESVNEKPKLTATNKESVNNKVTTALINKESVTGKSTSTAANKQAANDKSTISAANKQLANGKSTISAANKQVASGKSTVTTANKQSGKSTSIAKGKVLVNGDIDHNFIYTKRGNIDTGLHDKKSVNGKSKNNNGKIDDNIGNRRQLNGESTMFRYGRLKEKGNGGNRKEYDSRKKQLNVKNRNGNGNGKGPIDGKKSYGSTKKGNTNGKKTNKKTVIGRSENKSHTAKNDRIKMVKKVNNKSSKMTLNTTTTRRMFNDLISGESVAKLSSEVLPDGSYVKGPEVHVPIDHSVVNSKASRKPIRIGKPSLVNEQTDMVTISAASVEHTRLGVAPEMLTFGARESLKSNLKITPNMDKIYLKQTKQSKPKTEGKISNTNMENVSIQRKESTSTELHQIEKSPLEIVSSIDISKGKPVIITEEEGSVSIPNNTITELNPVFAKSEIKITIETSNVKLLNNENATRTSVDPASNDVSASTIDQSKEIMKIKVNEALDNTIITDPKQARVEVKTTTVRKNSVDQQPAKETVVTALQKTVSTGISPRKRVGASQNSETRKSTTSELLNPILQLMNIFRSDRFVENVSAVKIEIITKQNGTDIQKPLSKEREKQSNKARVNRNEAKQP